VHNGSTLEDGTVVTKDLVREVLDEESARIRQQVGGDYDTRQFKEARDLFEEVALADEFVDFLTLPAYDAVASS
jgi:malate synthase